MNIVTNEHYFSMLVLEIKGENLPPPFLPHPLKKEIKKLIKLKN